MNTRMVALAFLLVGAGFVFCVPADTEASSRGYRSGHRVEERIERRIAIITERLEARKARVEAQKNRILQRLASVEERLHAVTAQYACWLAHHTPCTSGTDEDGADTSTDDTANEEAEDEDDASDTNTDTNTGDDDTTEESGTGDTDDEESNNGTDEENEDATTEGDDNSAGDTNTDDSTTEDEQSQDDEEDTDGQENDTPDIAVRVNEIAWMGSVEGSTKEWIEIYNSGQGLDLAGWTLTADDGAPSITLAGTISANGYFLLERTSDVAVPSILADQIYTGDLSNGGEVLRLRNASSAVVDTVDGSGGWTIGGNNTTKETLQRMGDGWGTATGTPRSLNASI